MTLKPYFVLFLLLYGISPAPHAQQITSIQGSFSAVKSEKKIRLQFTYDSLTVGKMSEAVYVKKRVAERNKKPAGDGDAWEKNWYEQRNRDFEPGFCEYFMQTSAKDTAATSDYTIIFHTTYIEQGFSSAAILMHKNPEVRGEMLLVKTADPSVVLGKAILIKAMGHAGPHFETGDHINGCYAAAGEALGTLVHQ